MFAMVALPPSSTILLVDIPPVLICAVDVQETVKVVKLKHSCSGRVHDIWIVEKESTRVESDNSLERVAATKIIKFYSITTG